jgi:hypothetical protein
LFWVPKNFPHPPKTKKKKTCCGKINRIYLWSRNQQGAMDLSLFFAWLLSVARLMYSLSRMSKDSAPNVFALGEWRFCPPTPEILAAKPGSSAKRAKAKPTARSRCGSGALASACLTLLPLGESMVPEQRTGCISGTFGNT